MADASDQSIGTRHSLLSRLKDWDDQDSWRDFFNTYWKLIYGVAIKSGLTDAEAQDVVQETVLAVAKKMNDFKYDPALGSFKGWLLQLTRWRIVDQFRKRMPQAHAVAAPADKAGTSTNERLPDPKSLDLDTVWNDEWQRNIVDAALDRVKTQVNPKHYQIFYHYVIKQQPVREVARTFGVNIAQVYIAKQRVGRLVRQKIQQLEQQLL